MYFDEIELKIGFPIEAIAYFDELYNNLNPDVIRRLDSGNKIGYGYGVILFDGNKIINRK